MTIADCGLQIANSMLAQADLGNVPAEILKWAVVILVALVFVVAALFGIIAFFRKQKMEIEPQPFEVRKTPKRFNHELNEERHGNVTKRLDGHDDRIAALEEATSGMEARILQAGTEREERLQKQLNDLPGEIIATLVNAKKLND